MRRYQLITLIILALVLIVQARQVNVRERKILDKQGREFYIRGTNVVVKVPPYIPSTGAFDPVWSFGPEDIQILKNNGFNAIRLGMMWAGVEPKKDWYNQTYLDEMVKIVNTAGQAGIYTLIDYHQDILSEKFCGDGVPIWLMDELNSYKSFPFPMGKKIHLNASGLPDWSDCDTDNWGKYYFAYDVGQGFNDLYNPNHKLNKKFNDYWKKVAQTFVGNPYVIAYELINEPWAGNFWRNPALVIPSMGERLKLQNFYDKLSQTIRKVDSQTPLCFEPVTFDNLVPTGFSHPPGGNKFRNQSIFCFHHYHPPAMSLGSMNMYVQDGRKLKVATLLSQTSGGPGVFQRAQQLKQGWMYWQYKNFGKTWGSSQKDKSAKRLHQILSLQSNDVISLNYIRTFLVRVAGSLQQSRYNQTSHSFSATYFAIPNGQTVLFMQRQKVYGNSYMVNVFPESEVIVKEEGNYITIKYIGEEINKKILVSVAKL